MPDNQAQQLEAVFYRWWATLHDPENDGLRADRATLARLRRLDLVDHGQGPEPDLMAALLIDAFHDLRRRIGEVLPAPRTPQEMEERERDLFIVAATLARVRKMDRGHSSTAHALGGAKEPDRVMTEKRFLRLMRSETAADLFDQSRRLTALLKQTAPVGELARSLFFWRHMPSVRRAWARAYYHLDQSPDETAAAGV
ncbi:CRISPR-associated protein Cse2 (CRISPR_cse2) [mine drainage metagenome]|uniref:CRISPR-associated protein Cse2 (CRISPR_cse2) n=1 Tax=mine drainage metagenome TaxID=410659 RepID=A0A1J5RDR4_9ZZZZ